MNNLFKHPSTINHIWDDKICNIISQTLTYVKYLILRNMSNHKKPSENKMAEEIERPEWDWIKRKSLD